MLNTNGDIMKSKASMTNVAPIASDMNSYSNNFKNSLPSATILILSAALPLLVALLNKKYTSQNKFLYRILWVSSFALNLFTVQMPGRFDSQAAEAMKENNLDKFPWRTVFAPSGWAFAIWGVIYLSELLLTIYVGASGEPIEALRSATSYWMMGNIYQSMWCFCFRPSFMNKLYVPASQLALAALSFGLTQSTLTRYILTESSQWKYWLYIIRFPLSLHMAWLTAATLLNVNAWASVSKVALSSQVTLATACAYGATLLGCFLSWKLYDPFIGLTVAWALAALADRTGKFPEVKGIPIIATESLAFTESILSKFTIAFCIILPFFNYLWPIGHEVTEQAMKKYF